MHPKRILPLLGFLLINSATALPEDRKQAIKLSSDSATYENNRGVYSGHVRMSQGSLKINADTLTIIEADHRVQKIIARGRPAHFEQKQGDTEGTVVASANHIEYSLKNEEILLKKNATISHQGSEISGDLIVYNGRKQLVSANGGTQNNQGRVNMTLQPQSSEGSDNSQPTATDDQD
ncbi:MAG: lipopolysaccharide transport periplasmic protein LptA [Spongiibacteraceae bacterium]